MQENQQVSRRASFELSFLPDDAFALFSPEGERRWVEGWDPVPVFPGTIEFARNTVFRTTSSGGEALWTILDADFPARRAEYLRVAPESHTARIVVTIDPLGETRSQVTVNYIVTTFGERAANVLQDFTEQSFATKMIQWQQKTSACLEREEGQRH